MTNPLPGRSDTLSRAAGLVKQSHITVALTGAGISTPSGIPDFRTPGSGLWTRYEPMEVASLSSFRHNPEQFYTWLHPLAVLLFSAQPNPAHFALARLQAAGYLSDIITQNIDGLHTRAGAKDVLEVHGSVDTLTCTNCFRTVSAATVIDDYLAHSSVPYCTVCGCVLKPDIILYEEQLPVTTWSKAEAACRACDLLLVVGTSLEVMPSARLPIVALEHGAALIIVNQAATFMDKRADVLIRGNVAEVLPDMVDEVLRS